jgi:hypothetical protein
LCGFAPPAIQQRNRSGDDRLILGISFVQDSREGIDRRFGMLAGKIANPGESFGSTAGVAALAW